VRIGLLIVALLVAGCKSLPPECKTEYAHTISHCSQKPKPRKPTPQECEELGGVQIYKDGRYVGCTDQAGLERILRGL